MGSLAALPALDLKTPEQPDLLSKYAQLQQLRASKQEQQIRAQQAPLQQQQLEQGVQQGGLAIQQQQQALTDQKAQTAAMQSWDGKDINELYPLILKNGGSATAVVGLKSKVLEQQQAAATAFKNQADGGEALVNAAKTKGDLISGALTPLTDAAQVPDAQLPQALTDTVNGLVQKGVLDPQHAQAAMQLVQQSGGDPSKIRQGISLFNKTNMAQSQILSDAHTEAQTAQAQAETDKIKAATNPSSPLYSPSPAAVAMGTAPGAAQINAGEAAQAGQKAGAEAKARQPYELALAAQKQALSQGDPNAAGQLLANHDATLSELKSRGATPDFIARALFAAKRINSTFNPQQDEAQFDVAKSPANVGFFGSAKSLTDKGGTLDQLSEIAKDIPSSQIPALNSVADWTKAATGNGPLAKYASVALGAADDYSKVMGGGQGSDTSRQKALDLFKANLSPEGRAGSIDGVRGSVASQMSGRIGSNPVMQRMYGSPSPAASPASLSVGSVIMQNGHQYKVTAVDKSGKPTAADPVQ